MRYRFFLQAKEEYRIMKYHKQVDWAVGVIKRQYVQWKVCAIVSEPIYLGLHYLSFTATSILAHTSVTIAHQQFQSVMYRVGCRTSLSC